MGRRPEVIIAHMPAWQLERLRRAKSHATVSDRIRVVLLAMQGTPRAVISERVGMVRSAVQRWIRRWQDEGLEGLEDRPRSGQPTKLRPALFAAFRERILAGPTDADGVPVFRGTDIRRILREEFDADYSLDAVYKLLERLQISWQCPRPVHPAQDPEQVAAFRHAAPLLSGPSARPTPTSGSTSGSRMKPGSETRDS